MTSETMYRIILYAVSKNKQNGYVSPDDFYIIANTAQQQYLDFLLGEYQRYQPAKPTAPVAFSENQRLRTSLAALIYETVMPVNPLTGIATNQPVDFLQVDAMWGQYNFYRIRFQQQDKVWSSYHSVIDRVVANPIYYMNNNGFNFLPTTVGTVKMSYVRTPPSITWSYTTDSNGRAVWNPSTSQSPIWADSDCFQIIVRALMLVGVNLQVNQVISYASTVKQTGQ